MDSLANVLIFCRFFSFLKDPFSRLFTVLFSIAISIFYNISYVCLKSHISEAALLIILLLYVCFSIAYIPTAFKLELQANKTNTFDQEELESVHSECIVIFLQVLVNCQK